MHGRAQCAAAKQVRLKAGSLWPHLLVTNYRGKQSHLAARAPGPHGRRPAGRPCQRHILFRIIREAEFCARALELMLALALALQGVQIG